MEKGTLAIPRYTQTLIAILVHTFTSTSFKITLLIGTLSGGEMRSNCTADWEEKHC